MTGFSGADVAQLRQLAARMNAQSGKLDEIVNSSNVALMLAEWTGNDIDAIRNNWRRGSLPTLKNLATALHEASVALERNAKEQERVSGGSAPGWADNIIENIRRTVEGLFGRVLGPLVHGSDGNHTPGGDAHPDDHREPDVAPPPLAPTVPTQPTNEQAFRDWRAQHPDGSRLDYNGNGYLQCVELVNGYAEAVFPGHNKSELVGNAASAADMYAAASDQYFEKIPGPPQPGDIMVIGRNSYSPADGHVSIVESTNPLRVVQQSGASEHQARGTFPSGVSKTEMDALVGYLRPRR